VYTYDLSDTVCYYCYNTLRNSDLSPACRPLFVTTQSALIDGHTSPPTDTRGRTELSRMLPCQRPSVDCVALLLSHCRRLCLEYRSTQTVSAVCIKLWSQNRTAWSCLYSWHRWSPAVKVPCLYIMYYTLCSQLEYMHNVNISSIGGGRSIHRVFHFRQFWRIYANTKYHS